MAGIITTGLTPKLLWEGLQDIWGQSYEKHAKQYTDLFEVKTSNKNYEEDVQLTGFGLALKKAQTTAVVYDTAQQGFVSRYTPDVFSLGFIVTEEQMEDNLYKEAVNYTEMLSFSMNQTKEYNCANVYNRAFTSGYNGGDAVRLCYASHPVTGGTQSNVPTVAADLSEAALEDMIIKISQAQNDRGMFIAIMADQLIVHPSNMFNAERILKSTQQNDTANNAINAIKSRGFLPKGYSVNNYLSSTGAWFVRTNCPNGMKFIQRRPLKFAQDNDFDTSNAKFKASERYVAGWTDWRGLYGSAGA